MIITGIVVEYNPFHNGHLYHIQQAREITNCDILIAVMSPTFMQRGEPAIIDKFQRTEFALKSDIDLVVELPSIYAIQSANHFANGAIKLLNELKVDFIVFGSESNDVKSLIKAAQLSLRPEYQNKVKEYLKQGIRYANACNDAFIDLNIEIVNQANDILALAYIQEIEKNNYNIIPMSIKRTNNYLSTKINSNITSATSIRYALENELSIENTTPMENILNSKNLVYFNDYFLLLKYQINILEVDQLAQIHGFDEGLEFLFKKYINKAKDIYEFIDLVSSKRYPKTRIQRNIIYILTNLTKNQLKSIEIDYLRILGMNNKGQQYLKMIKNDTHFKIITTFSKHKNKGLDFEKKVTFVYSLANPFLYYLNEKEYSQSVIIK